ncbi:MAG: multidrug ABC transporter ATPase [Berkelbacteria bacterium GW2011_GWA2_38_9]|uniref:Multidrug ABC transporter ATPase n=2 Tax=Bacteria candidate phyla TaxID=1783234 RepID=A0A0G0LBP1_9BACT|nr:MAG: multidrug ABC transporter ATPase [Berkelbacteria bacterium GW2011_GWA2_38_9]KKR32958.1 MAG: multidrug ABC transporter ATPase [Candidatus Gottesmanbacteria bacterium GW2011_GWC2_39_8]
MTKNVIQITDLKKHFGPYIKAVDGVSFDVEEGEVFGFLGPNGAGKTTTIRCLMDFLRPTSGSVTIFGKDARACSVELKSEIGFLAAENSLYGSWTGNDHLKLQESIRGKSKILPDLISRLNFDPKIRVSHLSTGNKQKLALILALMNEPKLLILDEPTAGLDPLLQNVFYELLKEFRQKGTTILMSSHNLHEVEEICDRVGIIKKGKMVAVEKMNALRDKRLYRVTCRFAEKFAEKDFNLPDIDLIDKSAKKIVIKVRGNINPIMKKINKYTLENIEIVQGSVEDVFMEYYK